MGGLKMPPVMPLPPPPAAAAAQWAQHAYTASTQAAAARGCGFQGSRGCVGTGLDFGEA